MNDQDSIRHTIASLSVAVHALREEPYERLPYLAGTLAVAVNQMEQLQREAIREAIALRDTIASMKNETP